MGGDILSPPDSLDHAARELDRAINKDNDVPSLTSRLYGTGPGGVSGLQDKDYPGATFTGDGAAAVKQFTRVKRVPLPAELVEHFGHMQCNCNMGLFPEVSRAWLTIDSDIYLWRYEDGGDLAFFDGLADTILQVSLATPKPGILQPHIKHLLCLATPVEIVLLGLTFATPQGSPTEELQLLPEPLFTLPCEQLVTRSMQGTANGRIFMGGKDGSLYEFAYQSQEGWFGKKTAKINHSSGKLSWIMPSLLGLGEEDPILQIEVDNSRNILYTRSEKGAVTVYDLGVCGQGLEKVACVSATSLLDQSSRLAATVETNNLKPIVHIAPVCTNEDKDVHLMALTGGGSRLYLSTKSSNENNPEARPTTLKIIHVRLPPGFAPSAPPQKPTKVHSGYYKSGLTLLASSPSEAQDILWLIWNGSLPPLGNCLMEGQSVVPVEGHTWAIDEIQTSSKLVDLYKNSFSGREPPAAVVQHCAPSRQMIVLSAQGAIIISALTPVDTLRQLLIECGGPESEAVKLYFTVQGAEQAAATALILAASQSIVDRQVSEWCSRALYLYGGEAKLMYTQAPGYGGPANQFGGGYQQAGQPAQATSFTNQGFAGASYYGSPAQYRGSSINQISSPQGPGYVSSPPQTTFHPNMMSTPAPGSQGYNYQPQTGYQPVPDFKYSDRHNGLYLYISRILRPLWGAPLITGDMKALVTGTELEFIINQLQNVRVYLDENASMTAGSKQLMSQGSQLSQLQQRSQQDALLREKQSLMMLRQLVLNTLQVLGLWMVVVDSQVELVITQHLNNDNQNLLKSLPLRDLVVTGGGRELSLSLIECLIQRHLVDSANTDGISNRLREVCPGLYRAEDAMSSKAHELLLAAAQTKLPGERDWMVQQAVEIAKQIAGSLRLDILVSHLTAVHAYTAVVEICLAAAAKKDPQGLALHFYTTGENPDDSAGLGAYRARMDCYRHCTAMLKTLLSSGRIGPSSPTIPSCPGPPPPVDPSQLAPAQASEWAEEVFRLLVRSDDEMVHVALYQWLIDNRFTDRLLSIQSPYLENYLKRSIAQYPEQLQLFDIIWKYYEKNSKYLLAAKILDKLSDRHSTELKLSSRVEYLSRAIMCVKSAEGGAGAGELLHHLEEKMEVARVQLMVLEAASCIPAAAPSLSILNADLLDITTLYQDWAEPYQMWECKLAILATAGHPDPLLIQSIWTNIIERELERLANADSQTKKSAISGKIDSLGRLYVTSSKYFPLEFLVKELELFSCKAGGEDFTWVPLTLQKIGVDLPRLLDVYNRIYLAKEAVWLTAGDEFHILRVLAAIIAIFAEAPSTVNSNDRRQFIVVCQDAVSAYLGELYMKQSQETAHMVSRFRDIQSRLNRI